MQVSETLGLEKQLIDALNDIYYVTTARDNYGPGTRTKDELQRRLQECGSIAADALKAAAKANVDRE